MKFGYLVFAQTPSHLFDPMSLNFPGFFKDFPYIKYNLNIIYIDVKIVHIHFLFVFLAGAGGDTVTSDDPPAPDLALPGAEGVISLLLRFGGATGAGAGSGTADFNVAEAAETLTIRIGDINYIPKIKMKLPFLAWSCANLASRSCCRVFFGSKKNTNCDLIHDFDRNLFPLMPGLSALLVSSVEFENSEFLSYGPTSAGSGAMAQWLF